MKEVDFQRKICKRIEEQGGFGRKWSSEFQAGPPDLVLSHSQIGGVFLMEVKLIKSPPTHYRRDIGVTRLQNECMKEIHDAGGKVCIGLVHYFPRRYWDLILLPWNTAKFAYSEANLPTLYSTRQDMIHNKIGHQTADIIGRVHDFFGNN